MTKERWQDILSNIKDNFVVSEHEKVSDEEEGGREIERIVFDGPLGRMLLEFTEKPAILDKKTIYSNRAGAETEIKYTYSDTEKAYRLNVYKWDEAQDDWVEMEKNMFND